MALVTTSANFAGCAVASTNPCAGSLCSFYTLPSPKCPQPYADLQCSDTSPKPSSFPPAFSSSLAAWPQISRCTYSNRPRHKSSSRGKLFGLPTSMAFEQVACAARGSYFPLSKYCGTTSLAFVAAMNFATGSPIRLAKSPAVKFPKFPLGTATTNGVEATGNCR